MTYNKTPNPASKATPPRSQDCDGSFSATFGDFEIGVGELPTVVEL